MRKDTGFMMGVRKVIVLVLVICGGYVAPTEGAVYEKYVDEVVNAFVRDIQREHGLICVGKGGQMPTSVVSIAVCFHAYKKTSLEEARELMVQLKENLVRRVNAHEKIRPFLQKYPFTWEGADISVAFLKPKSNSYYLDSSVAFMCSADWGLKISYNRAEIQKRTSLGLSDNKGGYLIPPKTTDDEVLVSLAEETCEEARRIVNEKTCASKWSAKIIDAPDHGIAGDRGIMERAIEQLKNRYSFYDGR